MRGEDRQMNEKNLNAIVTTNFDTKEIDIDFVDVTLSYLDNVTLQSDGISNWIIK